MPIRSMLITAVALLGFVTAMTPAGTVIPGRAAATIGGGETYFSNHVETTVQAICTVSITPNGTVEGPAQTVALLPGGYGYLPFQVTNGGNDTFEFPLAVEYGPTNDWVGTSNRFYIDADRNGRVDPHEGAPVRTITLPPQGSAQLLLEVTAPNYASGRAWVTPATGCAGGDRDNDNFAELRAVSGPVLALETHPTPARVLPGEVVTFDITLTNLGAEASTGPIYLEDYLNVPGDSTFSYVSGSARTSWGEIEFLDGNGWTVSEPSDVAAVRAVLPRLEQDQQVLLTFEARASAVASPGFRTNLASAKGHGGPARFISAVEVLSRSLHFLGPAGNPAAAPGGEGSADDLQTIPFLLQGEAACAPLSLLNSGTASDRYEVEVTGLPSGIAATLRTPTGVPMDPPVPLLAGEEIGFDVCFTMPAAEPSSPAGSGFEVSVRALSEAGGGGNSTRIAIGSSIGADELELELLATPGDFLDYGSRVEYTLRVTNRSPQRLTDLRLRFPLPKFAPTAPQQPTMVGYGAGGLSTSSAEEIVWSVARLDPGQAVQRAVILEMPGGSTEGRSYLLPSRFSVTSNEVRTPRLSNELLHFYPSFSLLIDTEFAPPRARVGDLVWIRVKVTNPTSHPVRLELFTSPPDRTVYQPGSSSFLPGDGEEFALEPQASPDPLETAAHLADHVDSWEEWEEGEYALYWDLRGHEGAVLQPAGEPGDQITLSYRVLLSPGVAERPFHLSAARGTTTVAEHGLALASDVARAQMQVERDSLNLPNGFLTGRVFLDGDRNGIFGADVDTPLPGARLVLANGWQVVTDSNGLYAFREVAPGPWGVVLDRRTAPFAPLWPSGAGADPFSRHVSVSTVTVLDFPMGAPEATVEAGRSTELRFGPVTILKTVTAGAGGSVVTLLLRSEETLRELVLLDPVPGREAESFEFEEFEGETEISYLVPSGTPLTDPQVRWREDGR